MKIENEVTGKIVVRNASYIIVDLFSNGIKIDWLALDYNKNLIDVEMDDSVRTLLNIGDSYDDYLKLIADLGLKIPPIYKRHWTPKIGEDYFHIDFEGESCANYIANCGYNEVDKKREENYNMFPTRELAKKVENLSKLGKLIFIWQYSNDCLFVPNWKDNNQPKYYIKYDHSDNTVDYYYGMKYALDSVYFDTEEQIQSFIKMYSEEIKKIMGVKS